LLDPAPREDVRSDAAFAAVLPARVPAARPSVVRPLAPARYQVQVTVSAETHAKLLRARDLLRHSIPSGDPALILDRALTVLLGQLEKAKFALVPPRASASEKGSPGGPRQTTAPPGTAAPNSPPASLCACGTNSASAGDPSRYIPAAVRREAWARSGGRCEFVSEGGHRCEERGFLEYHHRVPFAAGGASLASNISVFCKSHNQHEAERYFGAEFVGPRGRGDKSRNIDGAAHHGRAATPTTAVVSPSLATVNACRDPGEDGDRTIHERTSDDTS
jgi:hypothetical protein